MAQVRRARNNTPSERVTIPLASIYRDWHDCTRCHLGQPARKHVLWETIKASSDGFLALSLDRVQVMIVGEAPGMSEDVIGRPFIGPSGQLLREAICNALQEAPDSCISICLTNLLACRPFAGLPSGSEVRAPEPHEVEACHGRLVALMRSLQPKLVIAAGSVPHQFLAPIIAEARLTCGYTTIRHPAWVIRQRDQIEARKEYAKTVRTALAFLL